MLRHKRSNQTVAGLKHKIEEGTDKGLEFKSDRCGIETVLCNSDMLKTYGSNQTVAGLKPIK